MLGKPTGVVSGQILTGEAMELTAGKVAVVTGAASGIGLALAERFARAGLDVVLADVEETALQAAAQQIASLGVKTLAVPTDVSDEAAVNELAAASVDRFGAVHVVCNNAGVTSRADPWSGPVSAWRWVLGVNLWGVIHGIRAFLPLLTAQRESHIVNTASAAGLIPATTPAYDAAKHAVVAVSEDLYRAMKVAGLGVGVSVVCPGWVRAGIGLAERNWPQSLGEVPPPAAAAGVMAPHYRRAISEGMAPAAVAGLVADAIAADRFWVFTVPQFTQTALDRWHRIAEGRNPQIEVDLPGFQPGKQLVAEIRRLLAGPGSGLPPRRRSLTCASNQSRRRTAAIGVAGRQTLENRRPGAMRSRRRCCQYRCQAIGEPLTRAGNSGIPAQLTDDTGRS